MSSGFLFIRLQPREHTLKTVPRDGLQGQEGARNLQGSVNCLPKAVLLYVYNKERSIRSEPLSHVIHYTGTNPVYHPRQRTDLLYAFLLSSFSVERMLFFVFTLKIYVVKKLKPIMEG